MRGKWSNPLPSVIARQYLLICTIDTAGRRWQKGERKRRDLSSKNYTPFTFSPFRHQHRMTGQQYDQPLMAAAPVWMRRPLRDRTLGPSACKDLRLSPQHNPSQLNPVTGRPLITPVHRAKNNSGGLNHGRDKIKMNLCLQLSVFKSAPWKQAASVKPTSRVHRLTLLSCLLFPCFPSSNLTWSE